MKLPPIHPPTGSRVPLENRVFSNKHEQIHRHRLFIPLHIGPECRLFAVKSTSAETGMGVTSRP